MPVTLLNACYHTLVTHLLGPSSNVATRRVEFKCPLNQRTAEFLHVLFLLNHGLRRHHRVFHLRAHATVVEPRGSELGSVHAIVFGILLMDKLTLRADHLRAIWSLSVGACTN